MSLVPYVEAALYGKDRIPCSVRTRDSWSEPTSDARVSLSETSTLYIRDLFAEGARRIR